MHTEDEAKTKWCPQLPGTVPLSDNNKCIGPACMAWRWGEPLFGNPEKPLKAVKREDGTYTTATADKVRIERGYCGLAGRPEVS